MSDSSQKNTDKAAKIAAERARILKEVSEYRPSAKNAFQRAFDGMSRSSAIHAFCLQCTGYCAGEIKRCTIWGCPLWEYRWNIKAEGESQ